MQQEKIIAFVQQIVLNYLEKKGFLTYEWQYGKIAGVNEDGTLQVRINGSGYITPNVPSNPDVTFNVDDYVWVQYVNRNPNNLFVPYKRHVKADLHIPDSQELNTEELE